MLGDIFVSSRRDALRYERLMGSKAIATPRFELLEWKGISDLDVSVLWAVILNERYDPQRHKLFDLVFHSHSTTTLGKLRMKAAVLRAMFKELIGGEVSVTFLHAFPPELVNSLAQLPTEKVPSVAEAWRQALEKPTDRNAEFVEGLHQLISLGVIAKSRSRSIYLWSSV